MKAKPWYRRYYRRVLLDSHIGDGDPKYLAKFDPEKIVNTVAAMGAKAMTVFANSHTGLCYWPTKVGKMHPNLDGRDVFGEYVRLLHQRDINVVAYYCLLYTDWYYDTHPDCRTVDAEGHCRKLTLNNKGNARRFAIICPNNKAYQEFALEQLRELCTGYDFEGVWPDMTWWPTVCYCQACRDRYAEEVGGEIPRTVNWEDPVWVNFASRRRRWLAEFTAMVTDTIKKHKPQATVAHQSGGFISDWVQGASVEQAEHLDWLSADLYGSKADLSYAAKLFHGLSRRKPFEYVSGWYPNIHEFTTTWTLDRMRCAAFSGLMNDSAIVFIGQLNPDGTLYDDDWQRAGCVFDELEKYEPHAGGRPCRDVGVYHSFESLLHPCENGRSVMDAGYSCYSAKRSFPPDYHKYAAVGMVRALMQEHIPHGVVTRRNMDCLKDYQVIVLDNCMMFSPDEVDALGHYVRRGGSLIATKDTGLLRSDGTRAGNFLLSEVLGVSLMGPTEECLTYAAPTPAGQALFEPFRADKPVSLWDCMNRVRPDRQGDILATITLPYTNPKGLPFASLLNDPPGRPTEHPAVFVSRYGKGRAMYLAGAFEIWNNDTQRRVLAALVRHMMTRPPRFQASAPGAIELALYDQPDRSRFVLHVLNFQSELPNIPVSGVKVRLNPRGKRVKRVRLLPQGKPLPHRNAGGLVEFAVPTVQTYRMVEIFYR